MGRYWDTDENADFRHKIEEPTEDRDYYKHFAARDLANTQDCVVVI